jgi:catechol 2,3-dioxygenase-like lactoylglutathione lyase family enzyme
VLDERVSERHSVRVLGHLGLNVADLEQARSYWAELMPVLGFELYVDHDDEFAYRPAAGKRGTYLFFYPSQEPADYSRHRTGLVARRVSPAGVRVVTMAKSKRSTAVQ